MLQTGLSAVPVNLLLVLLLVRAILGVLVLAVAAAVLLLVALLLFLLLLLLVLLVRLGILKDITQFELNDHPKVASCMYLKITSPIKM